MIYSTVSPDLKAANDVLRELRSVGIGDGLQFTAAPHVIARAIAAARAEERERCAKVALEAAAAPSVE